MKAVLLFFAAAICTLPLRSQDVPLIKVGETELGVSKLYIDVAVVGNRMTTTYDMYFYNPSAQLLEGELSFPLDENQSVSRFALEVNGKLREAVAVEKEQGRVAFEAVVRRKIDPALLEKGTGNNYKARIYPIPANGYKRVLLAYEEELSISNDSQLLKVPLSFKRKLEDFTLEITADGPAESPKIVSGARLREEFKRKGDIYVLSFEAQDFKPSQEFVAKIPVNKTFAVSAFEDYVYAYRPIESVEIERKRPQKIRLFWDVSYSMIERDLAKEVALLEAYFGALEAVQVEVVRFSDAVIDTKNFKVENGGWSTLKAHLESSVYDGATNFTSLFNNSSTFDELLVFTDGMNTLSDFPRAHTQPLFVINSIRKANHAANKGLSEANEGGYINLSSLETGEALAKLRFMPMKFLGIKTSNSKVESYPEVGAVVFNDFSFAAKGLKPGDEVELSFGYGKVVTLKEKFVIPPSNGDAQVAIIWAQKKVKQLQTLGDAQRDTVIEIAKEFNLVTNYTSLIVLETLDDYKRFAITPPKELSEKKKLAKNSNEPLGSDTDDKSLRRRAVNARTTSLPEGEMATLGGTVTDENGLPLPGVNVLVSGTRTGTQTNFDGKYSIEAPSGSDLVFSYLGYATLETTVRGNGSINIAMQPDAESLAEVLITGYGRISRERKVIGYSVATITSEEITEKPEADIVRSLNGKVSGVQITGNSGASGSGTNFIIRSKSSINGDNQPLFIVDGIPFNSGTNSIGGLGAGNSVTSSRFLDLDPNVIESVQVLKGLSASVLYGQAGRNGVVIIKTKNDATSGLGSSNYYVNAEAEREEQAKKRRELMKEKTVRELGFSTPYLVELQNAIGKEDMYRLYLVQREAYKNLPSYYIDVYDFFKNANADFAERVLSNIIEMDTDNYELLRVYAYKMEEKGDFKTAAFIYRQVLKLRSEDAQSYRDLALALAETGEVDEALSLLTRITQEDERSSNFRNLEEIRPIVMKEIANIIHTKNPSKLPVDLPKDLFSKVELDMRVVIDWNHNDTDIDLYVVDPNLEECYYGNETTSMGGTISEDMTEGFGPEEFTLEKAGSGSYYVKIDYFGDNYQKVENPTFMKVSIYEKYGTAQQQRRIKVLRLSEDSEEKLVERIALL